ncbi:probable secreted glycoprotein [Natronomonas pharaonis DSM 2160]|uniref:Probable secreted glycoprotein n=1 Tax=Natronomonas pharaonis (strain ATCC 35678 / DSM 2160 / CIP 103997 / JCM 8858 / NBRC 14720 / NCIMB 2260 / Gabara) TaxID=348780 RepID=A0A1U7EYT8_NATPD|nr:surface glycoprotein [Natronomonas pharaonis]CAI50403.1 probable secreted glycoprotein [Natronomonas pharaonis DSM 2160]
MSGDVNTKGKVRAVFLAAIMVMWMVAMSAAFAAPAAAADSDAEFTVDDADLTVNTTNDVASHSIDISVTNGTSSALEELEIDLSDGDAFNTTDVSNVNVDVGGENITQNVSDAGGEDFFIQTGETGLSDGDSINITYDGVVNPETEESDVNVTVGFSDSQSGNDSSQQTETGTNLLDIESSIDVTLGVTSAAPFGADVGVDVTVENVGESDIDVEDIEVDNDNADNEYDLNASITFDNIDALSAGENETVSETFNTEDDTDATAGAAEADDLQATVQDADSGDGGESNARTLTIGTDDGGAVEVVTSDTANNPVEGVDVLLYKGSEASGNLIATGNTGNDDFFRFDGSVDGIDDGLAVGAANGVEYVVKAEREGFEASTRSASLDENNVEETVNPSLQRIITPDDIDVEFDPGQTVSIDDEIEATVTVTTDDFPEGDDLPLDNTPVEVTFEDNEGDIPEVNTIEPGSPTTAETGDDGTVNFTFEVDPDNGFDDIEDIVEVTELTFEATEGDDEVITEEAELEFVPDIGDTGTISGEADVIDEDIDVGTQSNIAAESGVEVHAVEFDRVLENTVRVNATNDGVEELNSIELSTLLEDINVDDFGEVEDADINLDYSDVDGEETGLGDVRLDVGDQFRVVTFTDDGDAVVQDPRSDYLTHTPENVEVIQNETDRSIEINSATGDEPSFDLSFLAPAEDYQVQQKVTIENESVEASVSTFQNITVNEDLDGEEDFQQDTENVFDASEDLTYEATENRFDDERAIPTDVTNDQGDFELLNLPVDVDDPRTYAVIAGGDDTDDASTAYGFANFRGYDVVNVSANAQGDQMNVDLSAQEFEPVDEFTYNLDVTVDNGDKYTEVPVDEPVSVEVEATQEEIGVDDEPEAAEGLEIDLEATDQIVGDLADETVTTDDEGVATTTFTGDSPTVGETNISASAESAGEVFQTEGSEQATIDVFQGAQITGDVVDDETPSNNLPGAEVTLFVENETGELEQVAETTAGPGGSFSFTGSDGVRSGQDYTVEATFVDEEGNEGTGFAQLTEIPGGTTNADIVIEDVLAPEGFEVSDLAAPAEASPGDEIEVTANVANTAGEEDTGDVTFFFDSQDVDSQELTLGPGETQEVSFDVTVPDVEEGDYEHGISTDIDSETATLTVTLEDDEPAEGFTLSNIQPGDVEVEFDQDVTASVDVTNNNDEAGETEVSLTATDEELGELDLGETTVELDAEATETVEFDVDLGLAEEVLETGDSIDYVFATEDDELSATLTFVEDAGEPEPDTVVEFYADEDGQIQDIFGIIDDFQNDEGAFADDVELEGGIFEVIDAWQEQQE